jgi:hypothetical protein
MRVALGQFTTTREWRVGDDADLQEVYEDSRPIHLSLDKLAYRVRFPGKLGMIVLGDYQFGLCRCFNERGH